MKTPPGFKIIDNCIKNHSEILEWTQNQIEWNNSKVITGNSDSRTSKTLFIPMLSWSNPSLIHEMNRNIWKEIDTYAKEYNFVFSSIEDVSIQKYEIGDYYKTHIDTAREIPRIVSAVLYLNTVDEGGETYFTHFDFGVKPVAGRLVIFPSNYVYMHEARAPISNTKVAGAYWARP